MARIFGETKGWKNRARATERQRQALQLHTAGAGYQRIADALGYAGPSGAFKAVEAALRKTLQEPADELRGLEAARLDALHRALWEKAIAGNLGAVDRVLRIMRRRAALFGLDAPRRRLLETDVPLREMAARAGALLGLDAEEVLAEAERLLRQIANERSER